MDNATSYLEYSFAQKCTKLLNPCSTIFRAKMCESSKVVFHDLLDKNVQ